MLRHIKGLSGLSILFGCGVLNFWQCGDGTDLHRLVTWNSIDINGASVSDATLTLTNTEIEVTLTEKTDKEGAGAKPQTGAFTDSGGDMNEFKNPTAAIAASTIHSLAEWVVATCCAGRVILGSTWRCAKSGTSLSGRSWRSAGKCSM
jgi:hypothetical protein